MLTLLTGDDFPLFLSDLYGQFCCMKNITFCLVVVFSLLLSACGGSGGEGQSGTDVASVNIGADRDVLEGQTFTLTAAVYPEGGVVTWRQVSGPFIEGFPIEDSLTAELTAPSIAENTELKLVAEYNTGDGQLVSDEITVTIENISIEPVAVITEEEGVIPPYKTYQTITLSAANSYDSDGEIRGYQWTQIDQNSPLTFIGSTDTSELKIQAPFVSSITSYQIQLVVTDNYGLTGSNTIIIKVDSAVAEIVANAGEDQTVDEFKRVFVDGSTSNSSISDITCAWSIPALPSLEFEDASSCKTSFVAPDVDAITALSVLLTVSDNDGNEATDTVIITVNPRNLGLLHDTGVTECYDGSAVIDCGSDTFPMQDGDTGRDTVEQDKGGAGQRHFDFTKLDKNGDEIKNTDQVVSCVRDNFTGLVWEVKEPSSVPRFGSLRSVDNYYSFDAELAPLASCPDDDNCGVDNYITAVNELPYCGGANWRLPTFMELHNIMDYFDVDDSSLLDREFFPYTPDTAELGHKYYWVSEENAEGGGGTFQWVIDLETGDDSALPFSQPAYVILVREP